MEIIHPLNLLFAVMLGAGLFSLVVGLLYERPVQLSEVEKLFGRGTVEPTLMQRLQRALDDARLNILASEFLRVSLFIAALSGLAAYLLTQAVLAMVLGFVAGGIGYWLYLSSKASKALADYEDDLPQVLARLMVGAQIKNAPLPIVAEHVAKFGPPGAREDWSYIATQLYAGVTRLQAFRVIGEKRGSHVLNSVLEILLLDEESDKGLTALLAPFQKTLQDRVRMLRAGRAKLSGPIRELWIVAAFPFVAVIVMQWLVPEYREIYRSIVGQVIVGVAWTVTLAAFALAYRAFTTAVERGTRFIGQLKSQPRVKLREEAAPAATSTPPPPSELHPTEPLS